MFKPKNIKDIIPNSMWGIVFAALIILIYGCIMIHNSLLPINKDYTYYKYSENYIERTEIYTNVFLEDTYTFDSLKGYNYKSELYFMDNFYNPKQQILGTKLDLRKTPKFRTITMYFTAYYVILTLAWLFVFYNLFMFVTAHNVNLHFYEKNSKRLFLSSRIILGIISFKIFSSMLLGSLIQITHNVYLHLIHIDYEFFTLIMVLGLMARLLKVIALAYTKGYFMEKEQELTV